MYWLLDADTYGLDYLLRDLLGNPHGVPQDAVLERFGTEGEDNERAARRRASEMIREGQAGMVLVVQVEGDGGLPRVDRTWAPVAYSRRWANQKYGWRLLCALWGTKGPNQETPCENPDGPWMMYKQPSRTPKSRLPVCEHCHARLGPTPANRERTIANNKSGRRKKVAA